MLTDIVVNFTSNGRKLRAIVPKNGGVRGVLILPDEAARKAFADKNGLTRVREAVPPEIKVKDANNQSVTLAAGEEDGPQVCYWVGSSLVCW